MTGLDPRTLLMAYSAGVFPMAEDKNDPRFFWVEPVNRGILPLETFHVSHSLRRVIRKNVFEVKFDTAFAKVVQNCADRKETWINRQIFEAYCTLFDLGFAHSDECWQDQELVGGLYGVCLGGAFFGESMFSKKTDASKVALCALVDRLKQSGFSLLDTQFITPHLARFGAIEIPQKEYLKLLRKALKVKADFGSEKK